MQSRNQFSPFLPDVKVIRLPDMTKRQPALSRDADADGVIAFVILAVLFAVLPVFAGAMLSA